MGREALGLTERSGTERPRDALSEGHLKHRPLTKLFFQPAQTLHSGKDIRQA
jgi:hypothetical protein